MDGFRNANVVASFAPAVALVKHSALVHDQLTITKPCVIRSF